MSIRTLDELLIEARRRERHATDLYTRISADVAAVERQLRSLREQQARAVAIVERDRAERERLEAQQWQERQEARRWQP